jgi:TRAP-type C4-dicarboxylate transport system substrate-binding protein
MQKFVARAAGILCAALVLGGSAAKAEPMQLRLATFGPPTSYFYVDIVLPWAEAVSKDSEGTVEIKHFGGGVLGSAGNMIDTVTNGAADIGWALQGTQPNKYTKSGVVDLPFSYETGEEGAVALWRSFASGLVASDYDGVKLFGVTTWPGGVIGTRQKTITKLEDIKGQKLSVSGKLRADVVTALGGTPVNVPVDEVYQALDKGVIDGLLGSITAVRQFRYQEVTKNWVASSLAGASAMLIMNKEKFASLPAPAKAAFEKHSGEALSRALGKDNDAEVKRAVAFLDEQAKAGKGTPVRALPDAEQARFVKAVQPVINAWIERTPNGRAVYDGYMTELAKVRAGK